MNKLKAKFENVVKNTAMSAQQIVKHKSLNLSKTQEDPEWDEPCSQFMKIHQELLDLIEQGENFLKVVTEMCKSMSKFGGIFVSNVAESDPDHVRKIAVAYDTIVKSCSEEPLQNITTRMTDEILSLLKQKLADMKPLLDAIDQRKKSKMEYDHYYFKLEQIRNKANSDPNKVIRNQNKFQECQTALTAITDRLIDKFIEYETARPTFVAYEFQTLRSVQKEFFSSIAQNMSKFKVTEPNEGMPTEAIVEPLTQNFSAASEGRSVPAPRKGPRARRDDDDEDEEPKSNRASQSRQTSSQGTFRRPTPGASMENAFAKSGPRKSGIQGSSAPIPVDVDDEPAPRRQNKGVFARALYDFAGDDDDELPLKEGQKVRVTRQHESGWWTGEINGKIGIFPATYVELI